jgi:hypothetical protein
VTRGVLRIESQIARHGTLQAEIVQPSPLPLFPETARVAEVQPLAAETLLQEDSIIRNLPLRDSPVVLGEDVPVRVQFNCHIRVFQRAKLLGRHQMQNLRTDDSRVGHVEHITETAADLDALLFRALRLAEVNALVLGFLCLLRIVQIDNAL